MSAMYALSREYVCHPDNDAEPWIPSRCLTMDPRSDSDIPAFWRQATVFPFRYIEAGLTFIYTNSYFASRLPCIYFRPRFVISEENGLTVLIMTIVVLFPFRILQITKE
jgi:hypothetical protein